MPFPSIGPGELILILIIALVVLGPGKLPDVAQSLGRSVREFRKAATDVTDAGKLDATVTTAPIASPTTPAVAPATPVVPAPAAEAPTTDAAPDSGSPAGPAPANDPSRS